MKSPVAKPAIAHLIWGAFVLSMTVAPVAQAISLDWNGYFRADNTYLRNYQMDNSTPGNTTIPSAGGEFISGEGSKSTTFTTFFAKIKPTILVNDNVIIHTEWNIGDPVTGFFGRNVDFDQNNNPASTRKGELTVEAARLWMDLHTDFGLLQIGRAPMQWGLGVIFNKGDGVFDRYQSTSDTIRLTSKFGNFSIMPLFSKVAVGKNIAGSQDATGAVLDGSDDVSDYGLGIKYHNEENELEAGFLFYKRSADNQQDSFFFPHTGAAAATTGSNGLSLRLLDLYVRKTWYRLTVGAEVPFYSGDIGDANGVGQRNSYKATGLAGEVSLNFDRWKHLLKFGIAPGQEPVTTGARGTDFGAMYFHRNYKLGEILFNYNLGGFGSNNPDSITAANLRSPYDASISNAKYLMLGTENQGEHWSWSVGFVYAKASETAQAGKDFYIHRLKRYSTAAAVEDQGDSLGFEIDLGAGYKWDDNIQFGADIGMFFPGDFFEFDNTLFRSNAADSVFSFKLSAGVAF